MNPEEQAQVEQMIAEAVNKAMQYQNRKLGDTPTDDLQLTPKKYVDDEIASVFANITTSSGGIFGDGSDGSANFNGTSSVSGASIISSNTYRVIRNVFYTNVTIASVATVRPNNNLIFYTGTLTNTGTLFADGGNGGNGLIGANAVTSSIAGAGGSGGGGGSIAAGVSYLPSTLPGAGGGSGGGGGTNNGIGGVGGNSIPASVFHAFSSVSSKAGGIGGEGGLTSSQPAPQAGGRGSIATASIYYMAPRLPVNYDYWLDKNPDNTFAYYSTQASPSGGGGGAGGNANVNAHGGGGGGGGGGGAPGGLIALIGAHTINNGLITATGGTGGDGGGGGNGADPTGGAGGGTGGGGSGGDGGVFFYATNSYINTGITTVAPGQGGLAGVTPGSGSAGSASSGFIGGPGSVGSAGTIFGVMV